MEINWFTVVAQIINFLVLVWLMKRYLYQPILQAIDEREKKIAGDISDAKSKMAEAKREQDEFQEKNDAFDRHKRKLMDQATLEAKDELQKLLEDVKKEAAAVKQKLEDASKELQKNLSNEISQKTQNEVFSITKKVLSELASTNLEEQSVHVFINKIKAITGKDKKQFIDAFHGDSSPILIKSAFDLPDKEQKNIKMAIAGILGEESNYVFKTDAKMITGIELVAKSYKLSWSLAAYVNSLEKNISATMNETRTAVKK